MNADVNASINIAKRGIAKGYMPLVKNVRVNPEALGGVSTPLCDDVKVLIKGKQEIGLHENHRKTEDKEVVIDRVAVTSK